MSGAVHYVILHANFGEYRLRDFGVARGWILAFYIVMLRRLLNTLALPCECVIRAAEHIICILSVSSLLLSPLLTVTSSVPCSVSSILHCCFCQSAAGRVNAPTLWPHRAFHACFSLRSKLGSMMPKGEQHGTPRSRCVGRIAVWLGVRLRL